MNRSTLHQGFALPTLMVMMALASVAALLAMRNGWVNEQLLNAQADQLRTQHKVEAVLPLALIDIVGAAVNNNADATSNLRHRLGEASQTHAFFPTTLAEYDILRQRLGVNVCSAGICAPNALEAKTSQASYWRTQIATAMAVTAVDTPYGDNTAWYWVEVFPQANTDHFIYRITALANGTRVGSTTVLQAIWVRSTVVPSTGQWRSWHLLRD